MAAVFGVHVGNSSACLACFKDGKVDVVANEAGYRVTPAVVSFTEGEKITGLEAKAAASKNASSTIIHNKTFMYMNANDSIVSDFLAKSQGKIFVKSDEIKYKVQQGEKEVILSPDEVATCIYKSMLKIAQSAARSEAKQKAVLTVPLNLSDDALKRTRLAAEEAGFDVLQLISEPCAAALAYEVGMQDPSQSCLCLVFRVGGASIDASIVRVAGGVYSIESSVESRDLGGDQLNHILADFIAGEFQRKFKLDPHESRRSMSKLLSAAETWKHVLSNLGSADCFVESLHEGIDFRLNISRARFEMLVSNNLQDCLQPIHAALKKANLDSSKITHVIHCGGSLKIPKLQNSLSGLFPNAELLGGLNPDEVLAIGAAKQASYLPENWDKSFSDLSITVSAASKGILTKVSVNNDGWQLVIPAFSPIPFIKQIKYSIPEGQTSILADIAEESEADNPSVLGKVELCDMSPGATVVLEIKWTSMGLQASLSDRVNKRSVVEIATGE